MRNTHTSRQKDYKLLDDRLKQRTLMAKTSLTNLSQISFVLYIFEGHPKGYL